MGVLTKASERRTAVRRSLKDVTQIREVKLYSETVDVINISSSGLLMYCPVRLLPHGETRLRIVGQERSLLIPAQIVRCQIAEVSKERVTYLAAVTFKTALPWIDDELSSANASVAEPASPDAADAAESLIVEPDSVFLLNNW